MGWLWRWAAARKSVVASTTSATVIAALIATVAFVSGGYTAQRMDLNDGSVWVAKGDAQVIGRANTQVLALNTVVASAGSEIEVIQHGADVLLFDRTDSKVDIVDAATSKVSDSVPLPPQQPELYLAGDRVVIAATATGQVWVTDLAGLARFDPQSQAVLSLGKGAAVTVTPAGVLYGYSREAGKVYRLDTAQAGSSAQSVAAVNLGAGTAKGRIAITAVGEHWALLDATARVLDVAGKRFDLSRLVGAESNPVLQEPATDGDRVLVAHDGGLLSVPVGGGAPTAVVTGRAGRAAAPAHLAGCAYAAWSDGTLWRQCAGSSAVTLQLAAMPPAATRLAFQSNGDRVVLNDQRGGATWAVQQRGELIDNWDQLIVKRQDRQQAEQNNPDTPPEVAKDQLPPVAVDDAFGARPGRSSILPVLLNDYDPNNDALVISEVTPVDEAQGHLDLIGNGQQVRLSLLPSAHGILTFRYTITDGRGGSATASVTVTVRSPSENSPPQQFRPTTMQVAQLGRASASVLGDWIDPDGDPIYLASATTSAPDSVSFRPDGTVGFVEGGASGELRSITLVVSDGHAQGSGSVRVGVHPAGAVPIVADPFVVLAYAGRPLTVRPLEHVRGGSGPLHLTSVPGKTGVTIAASVATGSFLFTSDQLGTHYLDFVVNDGAQTATGTVRVDVAALPDINSKPITVPKTVFVNSLSSRTVNVADTDIDPAGGVLLVTGVYNLPGDSGVRAEVLDQRSIRVTLTAPLDTGPVLFNYRISNGLAQAEGTVTVIETPRPARLQPPIAADDAITVRVGDAVDIPVLDNDVQPDGENLVLDQRLSTTLSGASGLLFASGDVLRYLAPDRPGNFTATYQVSGPDGQSAQANVRIAVREPDPATNHPPVPATVTARVVAGQSVRVPIPLTGIDPDGDSVQLLGQESNPDKGAVTTVGPDYVEYQAGSYSAGTDSFRYEVMDALGARATGVVRVGISPQLDGARNPIAVDDEVRVRPGVTVSVQVLANDSDPEGSPLTVVGVVPNDKSVRAVIAQNVVRVTPPKLPGRYGLIYTIQNQFGGTSSNFITVIVDPDAPPVYPVVSDTVLTLSDILGRDRVDVDVLRNAFLADGAVSTLRVSLLPGYDAGARVSENQRIQVTVTRSSQIIPFAVAAVGHPDAVSYAFVRVPGFDDALPQVNRRARPLTVPSESELTINLNDYVVAVGGKKVRLADTGSVHATHANGQSLVIDDQRLRFTSEDKYFGPASISFRVTDGDSAEDPAGRTATLVLPIMVTPRQNQPPVFNGAMIDFEPGESKVIDLLKLTTYPYPKDADELAYTALGSAPPGFSYTLTGQELTLTAHNDAVKGTSASFALGVRDDLATGKPGSIRLGVVPSSRPLARPAADIAVTPRGQTTVVDVLANDNATNPFPGQRLSVVAIRGIGGGSLPAGVAVTPSADNSRLTVSVGADAQPADVNLQYQVMDATRDPDRYVWGTITLQIQDVPDPVTQPRITGFADRTLTVAWVPGGFNNARITGYEVTATAAGKVVGTAQCAVTSGCDLHTPGNGPANQVRVSIVAVNSIGRSEAAVIASPVWSDLLPDAPAEVTAVPAKTAPGAVEITWPAVTGPAGASALTGYVVRVVGAGTDTSTAVPATGTPSLATTLTPGAQYRVSVYARNSAQVGSDADWHRSAPTTVTAVGAPGAPGTVSAAVHDASGAIQVTWGTSDPNGAPADAVTYTVGRFNAGDSVPGTCQSPNPGSRTAVRSGWVDTAVADGGNYFYVVYADNGYFCTPTASGAVVTKRTPGATTASVQLQPSGTDPDYTGQYDIRVGQLSTSPGYSGIQYQYRIGTGPWKDVTVGDWLTSAADSSVYGTPTGVSFRACRDTSGSFCGAASAVSTLTPVNTRAGILGCVAGGTVTPDPPGNPGAPDASVTYQYAYQVAGAWHRLGTQDTVPPGATAVRVKATVQLGADPALTDPGYGEGACTQP